MKVDVYNRVQIYDLDPRDNQVLISISGPSDPATLKTGWKDILRLEFHDFSEDYGPTMWSQAQKKDVPIVYFTEEMAKQIREFIERHLDKDFAVHCDAGVSRSVAVGVYIRDVYEGELTTHAIHTTDAANTLVYRTLLKPHWLEKMK